MKILKKIGNVLLGLLIYCFIIPELVIGFVFGWLYSWFMIGFNSVDTGKIKKQMNGSNSKA